MRRLAVILLLLAAGCGGSHKTLPPTAQEWKSVLRDWSADGRVNEPHSCAAVRVAIAHLPPEGRFYLDHTLGGAERPSCR